MKKGVLIVIILVILISIILASIILINSEPNGNVINESEAENVKLGFFEKVWRKITGKCGDGICDAKEQANSWLCSKDCTSVEKTYYVSKQGDDTNKGTEEHPFLTIQKAADSVKPGDTVYVKKGEYQESINISNSQ